MKRLQLKAKLNFFFAQLLAIEEEWMTNLIDVAKGDERNIGANENM